MPLQKPLAAVDLNKDLPKILPNVPFLSSNSAAWEGIYLNCFRQPSHETPESYFLHHGIVLSPTTAVAEVERSFDGKLKQEQMRWGEVAIVPANISHICRSYGNIEFLVISLEPHLISQIAYESVNLDRVELIPSFTSPDPLIHQIGLALKAELEQDGSGSRFYAESMATALAAHLLRHYSVHPQTLRCTYSTT